MAKGRPKWSKSAKKKLVPIHIRISEEAYEYLDEMKRRGFIKARIVDGAILADKIKREGEK